MSESIGFYILGVFTIPVAIAVIGLFFEAKDKVAEYVRRKGVRFAHTALCPRCEWQGYARNRRGVKGMASEHMRQFHQATSDGEVNENDE